MLIFKYKKIQKTEIIINNIYDNLMKLDNLFTTYQDNFDKSPLLSKLTEQLDELWDRYWELTKDAKRVNVRYIGLGGSVTLNEALDHLLYTWVLVVENKLNVQMISDNWVNYMLNREIWNKKKKHF